MFDWGVLRRIRDIKGAIAEVDREDRSVNGRSAVVGARDDMVNKIDIPGLSLESTALAWSIVF